MTLLHKLVGGALEPMVTSDVMTFALARLDEIDQSRFVERIPTFADASIELHLAAAYAVALTSKVTEPGEFRETLIQQIAEDGDPLQ
ncbi:MAG: hypothetical protein JWQ81_2671 [Amycolatopsis sp.]|uniref:hypothetical protein n=1 Tax=Amycolatopsis sp. TaxID=37632 RepID=UPI0026339C90|nr:hypothetical protein [Amycolatopsis sp.]MCU1681932.1 hypothetical protein [Amycolatopsis sp.]